MGAMKRVRTAMTLRMFPIDASERAAYKSVIQREQNYRAAQLEQTARSNEKFDERDGIDAVYFRHTYVGVVPSREGQYLVIDTDTGFRKLVAVSRVSDGHLAVWALAERLPTPLDLFNLRSYRWFRMTPLIPEDEKAIRDLPLTKVQPACVG